MEKTFVHKNKALNVWRLTFGLALVVMISPHNAIGGSSIIKFTSETDMVNTSTNTVFGVSDASGKINVTMDLQGNANDQRLQISLANLNPNTEYGLIAYL